MNLEDARELFAYNSWANGRTLEACSHLSGEQFTRDLASSFKSVRDTLAHILSAQWIWCERWHGRSPSGPPQWAADCRDLQTLRSRWSEVEDSTAKFLDALTPAEFARAFDYKNLAGQSYTQPLWQTMIHVVNHGTYHRGQIATMLRQLGTKASATDLVAFYRERMKL